MFLQIYNSFSPICSYPPTIPTSLTLCIPRCRPCSNHALSWQCQEGRRRGWSLWWGGYHCHNAPRAHAGAKCTTRPVLHAGAAGQGSGGEGEGKWRIKVRGAWHSTFAHRRLGLHTASENGKSNLHVHREAVHCVVKRILWCLHRWIWSLKSLLKILTAYIR
jgi:hypothetical protein